MTFFNPSRFARSASDVPAAIVAAFERFDFDAASALCADDIVYQNVPLPPARGVREFEKQMRFFEKLVVFAIRNLDAASSHYGFVQRPTSLEIGQRCRYSTLQHADASPVQKQLCVYR